MELMNATSALALFETTKEERASFVQSVIHSMKDGDADPLKVHAHVKNTESVIKMLAEDKQYRALVLDAAARHGKTFDLHNAKFEIKEVGVKYDWSPCNDPELASLMAEQAEIDRKVKIRQDWLKLATTEGVQVVDQATGEVFMIYPPVKSSTTSIAVTLK